MKLTKLGITRKEAVAKVMALRNQGMDVKAACREVGIHYVTFYRYVEAIRKEPLGTDLEGENARLREQLDAAWNFIETMKPQKSKRRNVH